MHLKPQAFWLFPLLSLSHTHTRHKPFLWYYVKPNLLTDLLNHHIFYTYVPYYYAVVCSPYSCVYFRVNECMFDWVSEGMAIEMPVRKGFGIWSTLGEMVGCGRWWWKKTWIQFLGCFICLLFPGQQGNIFTFIVFVPSWFFFLFFFNQILDLLLDVLWRGRQ